MFFSRPHRVAVPRVSLSGLAQPRIGVKQAVTRVVFYCAVLLSTGVSAQESKDFASPLRVNDEPVQNRIVGGSVASEGDWPSLVALVSAGDQLLIFRHFCGGSVIADRWVLTAAHCMYNADGTATSSDEIFVVAGITDFQDQNAVETVVANIYVHPGYQHGIALTNDIALIELATSASVPPTPLVSVDPETLSGTPAYIAGWGLLTDPETAVEGDPFFSSLLNDASVPIVSLDQCNNPESYDGFIVDTQFCAGLRQGGVDSCQGDSGGPLYILEDDNIIQVGVTSWGLGCGRANFYGVYTDINAYRGWVSDYVTLDAAAIAQNSSNITVGSELSGSVNPFTIVLFLLFGFFRQVYGSFMSRHTSFDLQRSIDTVDD